MLLKYFEHIENIENMQLKDDLSNINFLFYVYIELDKMSIPKLGDQKFSTLAELLQEQDNYKINVSQTSMLLHILFFFLYYSHNFIRFTINILSRLKKYYYVRFKFKFATK